ncbi:MAG: FAD-dependent oxidoreductase, partial [Synergistaceae bacterium]|nr:FAD-dependent oxidoreductase [Synergistaceae bacterium]
LEIDTAGEEGVEFKFLSAPIEILEGGEGGVSRIKVQKMELGEKGSDGRRKPIPVHGAVEDLPADLIIVATGQAVDIRGFDMLEHKTDNTFIVDEETSMSSADGIFCAGDSLHGPGTVIEAIKMARDTASSVAEYLGENSILHENEAREAISDHDPASRPQWYDVSCDESCLKNSEASKIEMKVVSDRDLYHEDESPFPPEAAVFESKRCLNCGCVAVNASDLSPVLIALNAKLVTSDRTIDAADFFDAGINAVTVLDRNEYLKEIVIPAQEHRIQLYEKYRSRNAIDFPIVSVAAVLDVHHGTVRSAKLVLGAVKPVPYEPREVESFMESGILDERLIDEAADRAVAEAIPLAENAYKIQITKAMVKRVLRRALQRQ